MKNISISNCHIIFILFKAKLTVYDKSSNKRTRRLLNVEDFRRSVYWREAWFINFLAVEKFCDSMLFI